ncbi:TetR/AcrR family transcriptional regulator [Actinophytocola sp.]|uniref:TetR/AcrR family transcriptional regulator n=1 Tax=Actinophytocola sp. TaxID=1872138 RepID=UPI003899E8AC
MVATGTEPPSGKRAERSRRAIVAAARAEFLRDGFDASMDTIAARAGVSKVTVYNHFGSKEDLFTAVIGELGDETSALTMDAATAVLTDATDLRAALTEAARSLIASVTRPDVLAMRNLMSGELRRFPDLGRTWERRGPARFAGYFADWLRDQTAHGRLEVPDPEVATIQFYALTVYPHLVAASFGDTLPGDLADRLTTGAVDTFLARYEPR